MKRSLTTLAIVALACAPSRVQRRPAFGEFTRGSFEEVWNRSVHALESQGYQLEMQDKPRGILVTRDRELQAPCGAESCLSRERVFLRLTGAGQAILNIQREHWDPASRRWNAAAEKPSIVAVEKAQRDLLAEVVGGKVELRLSGLQEPCGGDEECAGGLACWSRRCYKACDGPDACPRSQTCSGGVCTPQPGAAAAPGAIR
ncbi:MAG TPA: hypothetical protein VF904_13895 [Anaeromyxobacteraceae bacterium]